MFIAKYYLLVAIIAFGLALLLPTVVLTAFFGWIGLSFLLVTIAYFADIPSIFRKISVAICLLLRLVQLSRPHLL